MAEVEEMRERDGEFAVISTGAMSTLRASRQEVKQLKAIVATSLANDTIDTY